MAMVTKRTKRIAIRCCGLAGHIFALTMAIHLLRLYGPTWLVDGDHAEGFYLGYGTCVALRAWFPQPWG
jgi:hypothetical protein